MYTALRKPTSNLRINNVFHTQHSCGQGLWRIEMMDGYDALRNDGPMIENGCDEVYGASMGLHTRCQRLCVGMKAWKGRQKGRMDINKPTREALDKPRRQHPHKTSQ
jgi:hypothetical protein